MNDKVTSINGPKDWSKMTAQELLTAAQSEITSRLQSTRQQRVIVVTLYDYEDGHSGIQFMNSEGLAEFEIRGLLATAQNMLDQESTMKKDKKKDEKKKAKLKAIAKRKNTKNTLKKKAKKSEKNQLLITKDLNKLTTH